MKKPQIDIFQTSMQEHINKVGFKNKFLRLWGHDGTVLTKRHYYYPRISANDEKLFRLLGVYKELKEAQGKMKGISSAWMKLDPKKLDVETLTDEILIQQLEFQIKDGIYTLNITPNTITQRTGYFHNGPITEQVQDSLGLLDYTDMNALGTYIEANYTSILNNYIVEGVGDTPTENLVAMYILGGSNAFTYSIKDVEYALVENVQNVAISREDEVTNYASYAYSSKSISIEIEINQTGIVEDDDPLVLAILAQRKADARNKLSTTSGLTRGLLSEKLAEEQILTNDIWLNGQMRVSIFSAQNLKTKDLVKVIQGSLGSGYKKKKVKWYKKLLAIVVFVVAFYFSGGTSAASFGAFASAFTIATLAVAALSAGMSAWGDDTGAQAVGKFSQKLNVISTFIGFAAMINSISTALTKEIAKEAAKRAAGEAVKRSAISVVGSAIKNLVTNYFKSATSNITLEKAVGYAKQIFGMYSENKLEGLQDKLKSVQEQNAEASQYEEESRSKDIGRELIKSHGEMFHQDSVDKYDYQYEPWSSPMHIGNIQRTSWKWERTGAKIGLRDNQVK